MNKAPLYWNRAKKNLMKKDNKKYKELAAHFSKKQKQLTKGKNDG